MLHTQKESDNNDDNNIMQMFVFVCTSLTRDLTELFLSIINNLSYNKIQYVSRSYIRYWLGTSLIYNQFSAVKYHLVGRSKNNRRSGHKSIENANYSMHKVAFMFLQTFSFRIYVADKITQYK